MIRIGEDTILLLAPDGRSVPFDPEDLQKRLENILSKFIHLGDSTVVRDIVSAVELAMSTKLRAESADCIRMESLDDLVARILTCAGMRAAADAYRRDTLLKGGFSRIPLDRIRTFLGENMTDVAPEALDRIAEKVFNTMKSIGADDSSPALALELARHFRDVAAGRIAFNIQPADFDSDKGSRIQPEEWNALLTEHSREYLDKRILKVNPVNLRIFPALRLELRLTGLAEREKLESPLTELALAPGFIRAARAADEICLAADTLFRQHGNTIDVPVKVLLHLSDASVFTRSWMGCPTLESSEACAENLCRMFAQEMTRVPFKLTCS